MGWRRWRRVGGVLAVPVLGLAAGLAAYGAGGGRPEVERAAVTATSSAAVTTSAAPRLPAPGSSVPEDGLGAAAGATTQTTSLPFTGAVLGDPADPEQQVALRIESRVGDVSSDELARQVLSWLNHPDGWSRAGFSFVAADASPFAVVLAEGAEVDELCLPLETSGSVSCQNGPVVALNAERWRIAVEHWDSTVGDYRGYLVNHEVGHLLGQRHPQPRCPVAGRPAGVMEQQTGSLRGCTGNPWPREWEIELARQRPVVYAPLPDWGPDPVPANGER
jgi:hypothetical protein